jgi:hypothetical protein
LHALGKLAEGAREECSPVSQSPNVAAPAEREQPTGLDAAVALHAAQHVVAPPHTPIDPASKLVLAAEGGGYCAFDAARRLSAGKINQSAKYVANAQLYAAEIRIFCNSKVECLFGLLLRWTYINQVARMTNTYNNDRNVTFTDGNIRGLVEFESHEYEGHRITASQLYMLQTSIAHDLEKIGAATIWARCARGSRGNALNQVRPRSMDFVAYRVCDNLYTIQYYPY